MTATRKRNSSAKKKENRLVKHQNKSRKNSLSAVVGIGLLAGLIILVIVITSNQSTGSSAQIEGVQVFPNLERGHTTQTVTYAQSPPVGGQHHPTWQNCGAYTQPIANENAVHTLEHGAIWITYQPDVPGEEVQKLQTLTQQSGYRLLSPFLGLPSPVVASAWGYQIQLVQADDPRLLAFIQRYEQNPQGPEPGAPCTGGVSAPG